MMTIYKKILDIVVDIVDIVDIVVDIVIEGI